MSPHPILLAGGSGMVGRWTARLLRASHPDTPLLIGGRDLGRAQDVAAEVGGAEGVTLDLRADDLGLDGRQVSAVAVLLRDDHLAALRFAQARSVPHVSISLGVHEIGPEVAAYMNKPDAAPVVLGAEWLVGATTIPTLAFAKTFGRVNDITIGALLDNEDVGGPAQTADLGRVTGGPSPTLARRNGAFVWRAGNEAKAVFRAVDGTEMEATALSPYDVVGLAAATGAPNIQFNLATGVSSTRRTGGPMSTEIIIEIGGEDHTGRRLRTRHAIVHSDGQFPLTGLGVAMVLERLVGLDGDPPTKSGLYFPYQLLDSTAYFARLEQAGGLVLTLDVLPS